jgi:hypothetical protein
LLSKSLSGVWHFVALLFYIELELFKSLIDRIAIPLRRHFIAPNSYTKLMKVIFEGKFRNSTGFGVLGLESAAD